MPESAKLKCDSYANNTDAPKINIPQNYIVHRLPKSPPLHKSYQSKTQIIYNGVRLKKEP
jgi:hypothetical protein